MLTQVEKEVTKSIIKPETVLLVTNGYNSYDAGTKAAFRLALLRELPLVVVYYPFPYSSGKTNNLSNANWRVTGNHVLSEVAAEAKENGLTKIVTYLQEYRGGLEIDELASQINAACVFLALE